MTFQKKHPLIDSFIDLLIQAAGNEARLQIGVEEFPELKLAKHLRKAQVQTRRSRKALVDQIKLALHRETHIPDMAERTAAKLAKKSSQKKSGAPSA